MAKWSGNEHTAKEYEKKMAAILKANSKAIALADSEMELDKASVASFEKIENYETRWIPAGIEREKAEGIRAATIELIHKQRRVRDHEIAEERHNKIVELTLERRRIEDKFRRFW